jgi:hypothetical protein
MCGERERSYISGVPQRWQKLRMVLAGASSKREMLASPSVMRRRLRQVPT